MAARELKQNSGVFAVGALDWDRRLFDELIPLPDGTTYNSYLIKGRDKTALLDTVDPSKTKILFDNLRELKVDRLDYIVAHHGEQDHSGSLPAVLAAFPMAKVVTNAKCREILKDLLLIPDEQFLTVADHETLPLGGKTLEFILAPWVHWPETMFTWLPEDSMLFTCDFLGSHLAASGLFADGSVIETSNKRYYAEIMMPFRTSVRQHLDKVRALAPRFVCPSHGPVFDQPGAILDAYQDWSSDLVKNEVIIPYVSMHGSTAEMVGYFSDALIRRGIAVKLFDLPRTDVGELAMALVDAATVVIGSPTVLAGPHPAAVYAAFQILKKDFGVLLFSVGRFQKNRGDLFITGLFGHTGKIGVTVAGLRFTGK